MTIDVIEYTEPKKEEWNMFVKHSNNGTLFHNLDFLSYHGEKYTENEHHLMFYSKQNLAGAMPLAIIGEDERVAKSPYGGSFGGVVEREYITFKQSEELVDSAVRFLKDTCDIVFVTPPPFIYSKVPSCYTEFNMLRNGFELYKKEITSVVALNFSDPFDIFEKRARTAVKKAKKEGVSVEEWSKNYTRFFKLLKQTKARHDAEPTHTLEELKTIWNTLPHSVKLDMAYIDETPVAGILYFICNTQTVLTFYICHDSQYNTSYPVNLLLYNGLVWAEKNSFKYLDLGTTTHDMIPYHSLFMFKESFGSTGYFRDTYVLDLRKR
jgi:lipid II:glycine glycyltransferase (peptidoglycan interpeptide bridge formation enzyme)